MNIRESLLEEHSKKNSEKIVEYIGDDPERFAGLFSIFISRDKIPAQRASMVLCHVHDRHPKLTDGVLTQLIKLIKKPFVHDAIKRTLLRTLRDKVIPGKYTGEVTDFCFKVLNGHEEPIAIKVFAMDILKNIVRDFPELKDELIFSIEEQYPYQSPGFKAHSRMVLKELNGLKSQRAD